jgi:Methyltransferase domain
MYPAEDYYAHFTTRQRNGVGVRVKQRIARRIVELARLPEHGRAFELGPGDGDVARLVTAAGCEYAGMDGSAAIAANLRAQGFAVEQGFAPPLPATGPLDALFALHVIEHMKDSESAVEFLHQARDRLCRGGRIVIATPDYARWGSHFYDSDYTHCLPFTARCLRQTIEAAGLTVVYDGLQVGPFFNRAAAPLAAIAKRLYIPSFQDLARRAIPRDIAARAFLTILPNLVMVGAKL